MTPTEKTATFLIKKHYGEEPLSVKRFTTGLHHYVYECLLSDGRAVVVRAAKPTEKPAMAGAIYWNKVLRPIGIPLPEIYFSDLDHQYPYVIMERLQGTDIGYVLNHLSQEEMDDISNQLMCMQKTVNQFTSEGKFGYAVHPENAPHKTWTDELRSSLRRSRNRVEQSAVFSTQYVDKLDSWITRCSDKLNQQQALPFLHDITTKNVIVMNGKLTGIVDVDNLCFGDPLFQIALTQMALLSDGSPLTYVSCLLKHYGEYSREHLALYTAICCVDFMSEIGQEFNGLNPAGSAERKAHLEAIFSKLTTQWMQTLELRELNETDEQAFLEGLNEWKGESPGWYSFIWKEGITFSQMLDRLRKDAAGIDLPINFVQHSMLYAFVEGKIIGRVSIRHALNDYLQKRGGHIGYAVAKRYRNRGYATEMVRQALEFCRTHGINPVMVTCADDNTPSWKIIERFGGQLQDRIWDEEDKEMIRRYWIHLSTTND